MVDTKDIKLVLVGSDSLRKLKKEKNLQTYVLGRDPDGSGMLAFHKSENEELISLEGRSLIDIANSSNGGVCFKSGEIDYYSPEGLHAKGFLEKAPDGTEIMAFSSQETWAGKTWYGSYQALYFGKNE